MRAAAMLEQIYKRRVEKAAPGVTVSARNKDLEGEEHRCPRLSTTVLRPQTSDPGHRLRVNPQK